MIYLASPYSHRDAAVREERYATACKATADLMAQGYVVYSPIAHSHPVAAYLPDTLLLDHEFWMKQCLPMVERSDAVWVLTIPGWDQSRGVAREVAHAEARLIPVVHYRLFV